MQEKSLKELPRISLITLVRNGAAFIERCLQSVAEQNYPNLEYIVMDGASTDGTQAIIGKYMQHITHFQSRPDKGPYDATIQAYGKATGDIVMFLMADDWLAPDALDTLAQMYREVPDAQIFTFGMQEHKLQADGALTPSKCYADRNSPQFELQDGLYCQGMNRAYARSLVTQEGFFRNDLYPQLADRDFYIRIGLRKVKRAWSDKVLYHFLVHAGSNSTGGSAAKVVRFLDETARIAQEYLGYRTFGAGEREMLCDWYCFNVIRAAAFRLKAGNPFSAACTLARLWLRYPARSIRRVVHWQMPEDYRAKLAS